LSGSVSSVTYTSPTDSLDAGAYTAIVTVSDTFGSSHTYNVPFTVALVDNTKPTARISLDETGTGATYSVNSAGTVTAVGGSAAPVGGVIQLGTLTANAGDCGVDLDFLVSHLDDECSGDPDLTVAVTVASGNVESNVYTGATDSTRNVNVRVGAGAFAFGVTITDEANNVNTFSFAGTVADVTAPVVTVPGNNVYQIAECATTTDVYFTVQAEDACDGSVSVASNVTVFGLTATYVSNGMFQIQNVAAGTYYATVSGVQDAAGNTAATRAFQIVVNASGAIVPRQIVGAGNIVATIPACVEETDVDFDLFIVDECAGSTSFSAVTATGGYLVTGALSGNSFSIASVPADEAITVTATSGSASYSFTITTQKASENSAPDITVQGNLTYTLPVCSLNGEEVTFAVQIDDDCDSPADIEANAVFIIDDNAITPTFSDADLNGQVYFEFTEVMTINNNGSVLSVSYGGSSATALITVLQEQAATDFVCEDNLTIKLDSDKCSALVTPAMVLKGDETTICNDLLQVVVERFDVNGNFNGYEIGRVRGVGVRRYMVYSSALNIPASALGKNSTFFVNRNDMVCWGTITTEDKTRPTLTCPDQTYESVRPTAYNVWNGALDAARSFNPQAFTCYQSTWPGGISEIPTDPASVPNPFHPEYVDPNAPHHYDTWTFRPVVDGIYTFHLLANFDDGMMSMFQQPGQYQDIVDANSGAPLSGYPRSNAAKDDSANDGWFNKAVPCSNVMAFGETVVGAVGGLGDDASFGLTYVTFDNITDFGFAAGTDDAVQRLSLPMKANKEYTLVVTSREANTTGSFSVLVERDGVTTSSGEILRYWNPTVDINHPEWSNEVARWTAYASVVELISMPLYCDDINNIYIDPIANNLSTLKENRCYTIGKKVAFPNDDQSTYVNPTWNAATGGITKNDAAISNFLADRLLSTGFPTVFDNCGPIEVCVTDQIRKQSDCGELYITRSFSATDAFGNRAEFAPGVYTCTQRIDFSVPSISNLTLPHFTAYLECDEGFDTDASGNPHPSVTGYPFMRSSFGYHDLATEWCNLAATYSDEAKIDGCAGGYKLRREWTVLDWCRPGKSVVYNQLIKVGDFTPPVIDGSSILVNNSLNPAFDPNSTTIDAGGEQDLEQYNLVLTYSVSPFDCDADFQVPTPAVSDNCSEAITVTYKIIMSTPLEVYDHFGNLVDDTQTKEEVIRQGAAGSMVRSIELTTARRSYHYEFTATDACGNTTSIDVDFQVLDLVEPYSVCDDELTVTLGGAGYDLDNSLNAGGYARIEKSDLQEGVSDNCSPVQYWVRRVVDAGSIESFDFNGNGRIVGDELRNATVQGQSMVVTNYRTPANGAAFGANAYTEVVRSGGSADPGTADVYYWQPYVEFFCTDAGNTVMVEILTIDEAGNSSRCWLNVLVEDKTKPYCEAPADFYADCTYLPGDFNPPANMTEYNALSAAQKDALHAQLDVLFGTSEITDNCNGTTAYQEVTAISWHCNSGTIRRRFWGTDTYGNLTPQACFQYIQIDRVFDYAFTFPADVETDECAGVRDIETARAAFEATFTTTHFSEGERGGCDLLSTYISDDIFEASGAECYKVFRTFEVVNWCQFSKTDLAVANPFIVGRNEDGAGMPGDRTVTVSFTNVEQANTNKDYIVVRSGSRTRREGPITQTHVPSTPSNDTYTQNYAPVGFAAHEKVYTPGYFQYTQVISVYDNDAPVVTATLEAEYCAYAACEVSVVIPISVSDACTPDDLAVEAFVWPNGVEAAKFQITASLTAGTASGTFPIGNHKLEVVGYDGCGNTNRVVEDLIISDCKAPSPTCISGIAVELMPVDANGDGSIDGGSMTIFVQDYVKTAAFEACSNPVKYSIHLSREPETAGELSLLDQIEQFVVNGDMELGDLLNQNQTSAVVTCEDAGKTLMAVVAAWDAAGNGDYCETFLIVQDNMNLCGGGSAGPAVAGLISTETSNTVENVEVNLSGQMTDNLVTNTDGNYTFINLQAGYDYTITPLLDSDHDNGVTTFDLIEIGKHILTVKPLGTPYKMIAADVDNNRSITTLDLIQLRRLILSVDTEFANNTSWRFVDASYQFPNPSNPWAASFPEIININDLEGSELSGDFVAIKVGDVTLDARANSLMTGARSVAGTFGLDVADVAMKAGGEYTVAFNASNLADIAGYQFTLNLDETVELVDINYGVAVEENFGTRFVSEGAITTSWNGSVQTQDLASLQLFELVLRAKADVQLSEVVDVTSRYTVAEAYNANGQLLDVAINFNAGATATAVELMQNTPNPFKGETVIGFNLPEAASATLTITDVTGKVLRVVRGDYARGYNQVNLNSAQLPSTGVLYYTLETGDFTATKKMIILE